MVLDQECSIILDSPITISTDPPKQKILIYS